MSTTTAALGDMLRTSHYAARFSKHNLNSRIASIENTVSKLTNNTSIETTETTGELPKEISSLITGSDYWIKAKTNRYKWLIRQGHLQDLLTLAQHARENATQEDPSHYFAHVCSKKQWEQYTLPFLAKRKAADHKAEAVVRRLGTAVAGFIKMVYKQIWKGANVERWACLAVEAPHKKPGQSVLQHFNWLCARELQGASV